jgi:hypothetical protein
MNQLNFETMPTAELRAYVLANRKDDDAFHALSDRIHQNGVEFTSAEELAAILEQKRSAKAQQ